MLLTIVIIVILIGVYVLFMKVYPVFGRRPSEGDIRRFSQSPQYAQNKFENQSQR